MVLGADKLQVPPAGRLRQVESLPVGEPGRGHRVEAAVQHAHPQRLVVAHQKLERFSASEKLKLANLADCVQLEHIPVGDSLVLEHDVVDGDGPPEVGDEAGVRGAVGGLPEGGRRRVRHRRVRLDGVDRVARSVVARRDDVVNGSNCMLKGL